MANEQDSTAIEVQGFGRLRAVTQPDGAVRLVSDELQTWLIELRPASFDGQSASGRPVSTAAGAAGAVAVGTSATAVVMLPVVIATAAAVAAAWAQQRWLERTFDELQASLNRIETRFRDDDLGALAAAESVLAAAGDAVLSGDIPTQLRLELALARQQTETIYNSRLRFVTRFKHQLETWQNELEAETGQAQAWTPEAVRALADDGSGTIDELVVYFQAMLTRARITAATAGVLAADGDSVAAIRMIDDLQVSIRRDYFDVHNRLSALSRSPMDVSRWRRLLPGDAAGKAHRTVELLAGDLDKVIGGRLPEPDAIVELPVDVGLVHLVA